ncbi:MAG: hypothetical protein GX862_03420 [Leucobacter sp.]|nr:hypothetical protein [Leucobacter sp.]
MPRNTALLQATSAAEQRVAFANAALGAAGHEIRDEYLNDLAVRQASGAISGDEARQLSIEYFRKR